MTESNLTVVMFHYVRDLARSRFPRIKARTTKEFRGQIAHIRRNFTVVGAEDLFAAVAGDRPIPTRALLLTFDDGYVDHFTNVFPILHEHRLPACFFPAMQPLAEGRMLEVNKIQFILASVDDVHGVVDAVRSLVTDHQSEPGVLPFEEYASRFTNTLRFDTDEVAFLKGLLQRDLPPGLRGVVVDDLFRRFVTSDEVAFAGELYASRDQLACMARNGMTIGCHGFAHRWMNELSSQEQARDLDAALQLLGEIGTPHEGWMMCYPYGAFDDSLVENLRMRGCAAALTTEPRVANLALDSLWTLPRLDTNDLPVVADRV